MDLAFLLIGDTITQTHYPYIDYLKPAAHGEEKFIRATLLTVSRGKKLTVCALFSNVFTSLEVVRKIFDVLENFELTSQISQRVRTS